VKTKCAHGYFTHLRCPWCRGVDDETRDVVSVVGHGNGWLLRRGEPICGSCGGPAYAGWGAVDDTRPRKLPTLCYPCRSGGNTREAVNRRAVHEARRGIRKVRGAKPPP